MIFRPYSGQQVRIWYATKPRRAGGIVPASFMPLHNRSGVVRIVSHGPGPHNHGIEVDGEVVAVPCGNLLRAQYERAVADDYVSR